ncbi:uncharacterized protein LOC126590183 [Malus sylvestris]|uniref:uncharacterized protein LOC126590183 n=1 Tax=Malus sylvestris TaxID=3752 RepID=UPI0021AD1BC5|nr:uncharacterized protein LOC126590183 [Malus sylvestris]
MEIFASSNRRSTLTVFMALAPNLHEPSWTTRSLFKKNSSNTEIASSSLAPHTRQYMQRKDLFMPSAAPASVYASSVILLAPPANLPSRPPSSTSSSSPSSSTSSPSSRSSPTSSPKTPALSPLPSKLHGYASPAAPASCDPISNSDHFLYHMVFYSLCGWFLLSDLCSTWNRHFCPLHRDKGGLPPHEKVRRIKGDVFACLIANVKPVASECKRKIPSSLAREPSMEKRSKTSSAAHENSFTAERLVIDLTSFKRKRDATGLEPAKPAVLRVARTVADRIT